MPFPKARRKIIETIINEELVQILEPPGENPSAITGWTVDVDFIDIDGDGDPDLVTSNGANRNVQPTRPTHGAVFMNRIIGDGFRQETRASDALQMINPVVLNVTPRGALPGQEIEVVVDGTNLDDEARFNFGQGVEVISITEDGGAGRQLHSQVKRIRVTCHRPVAHPRGRAHRTAQG